MYSKNMRGGFSLVELLIVISLSIILTTVVVISYRSIGQNTDLNTLTQRLVSTLDRARERTVSSENDANFGVHIQSDRYIEFKGPTYNASASDNINHIFSSKFEVSSINLTGGGSDVIFDRLSGQTSQSGTLVLRAKNDPANTKTIRVQSEGQVDVAGTVNPADTRLKDSRHLHFDLGWSLQGASTLTLVFENPPNPDTTYNLSMAEHFNADQSKFDWEDALDVNGTSQTLHIHTHTLTSTNTILSIHRGRDLNSKAVTVAIDNQEIVSYDAAGTATSGASGGTMTAQ